MAHEIRTKKDEERAKLIEHMLVQIEDHLEETGRANDFIESIRDQWDRTGSMSEKQFAAIESFYERI